MDLDLWDCLGRTNRKDKTHIITKFHRRDFVICSHSREGKTPSYSQINKINDGDEAETRKSQACFQIILSYAKLAEHKT